MRHLLGERVLLSNINANIAGPGGGKMVLHADQGYVIPPWPPEPLVANVIWMVDDFTEDDGATLMVPGSHRLGHEPFESIKVFDAADDVDFPLRGAGGSARRNAV